GGGREGGIVVTGVVLVGADTADRSHFDVHGFLLGFRWANAIARLSASRCAGGKPAPGRAGEANAPIIPEWIAWPQTAPAPGRIPEKTQHFARTGLEETGATEVTVLT